MTINFYGSIRNNDNTAWQEIRAEAKLKGIGVLTHLIQVWREYKKLYYGGDNES